MKKTFEYLYPIAIIFAVFYLTACLIEATFSIPQMDSMVRRIVFGVALGVSALFAFVKSLESIPKDKK